MGIVCITGASSGFGMASAEKFAEQGFDLILNARRSDKIAALIEKLTTKYAVQAIPFICDIRKIVEIENAYKNLSDHWKNIDLLINNAGLASGRDLFQNGNVQDWEEMIDTNFKGLIYVTKIFLPKMIEKNSGHIINVSSLAGKEVYPQGNIYCATKHAVTAFSKALRLDLIEHKIKVTNISPGLAETEFSLVRFHGDIQKAKSVYEGFNPLQAEDVADVIFFAATRPPHVNLEEITILPTAQSDSRTVLKK